MVVQARCDLLELLFSKAAEQRHFLELRDAFGQSGAHATDSSRIEGKTLFLALPIQSLSIRMGILDSNWTVEVSTLYMVSTTSSGIHMLG